MSNEEKSDHELIAEASLKVLQENPEGMLLSRLGQDLSRTIDSFKEKLGSKRLSEVLRASFGTAIHLDGYGPHTRVALRTKEPAARAIVHFEPRFWAAFAKPVRGSGLRRWVETSRPFEFTDLASGESQPAGTLEITASLIPDEALGRHDRANAVIDSIFKWCSANNLDPTQFRSQREEPQSGVHTSATNLGVDALRRLVAAVPVDERSKYNLPLDLIGRLLRQK